MLVLSALGCGGASSGASVAPSSSEAEQASAETFRDPLADVEPIRFGEREALSKGDVPHAAKLAAVCPEPVYDEVRGLMGCGTCPADDGFLFPTASDRHEVRRGRLRLVVHSLFEGTFAHQEQRAAVLLWEGCEWRSNGAVVVIEREGEWVAGPSIEGVPFGEFNHCEVARSPERGDRLICDGTLLTQYAGLQRMRGSTPYASTLTSFHSGADGDSDDLTAKVDMLLLSRDPEACDGPGARGAVVRSELGDFVIKDLDGDGADDIEIELQYLFAPAPSKPVCWEEEGLKSTTVSLLRRREGFEPAQESSALLKRLNLR